MAPRTRQREFGLENAEHGLPELSLARSRERCAGFPSCEESDRSQLVRPQIDGALLTSYLSEQQCRAG